MIFVDILKKDSYLPCRYKEKLHVILFIHAQQVLFTR
jgi:hypothetical protein